ncbi:NfeD family protein [Paenibacillus flagellatus]|uniref:Protease n=1 Tax=Paenibacillus flagellatus TaxID=2211139 RepID=A0A2V5K2H5_9BACL|nr:NfeD family protein [Paenibacillus flagellatus]PYI53475.1 protease [Paenibacillus flagellatus]
MEQLFWSCLAGGVLFAVVTVIFGDLVSHAVDGMLDFLSVDGHRKLKPMVIVSGITAFGGAGLLLLHYTPLGGAPAVVVSLVAAVVVAYVVYVAYVRPMDDSENSTAFSIRELTGRIGEVLVPIPPRGYGEVLVKVGAGRTNQIAASFDGETLHAGERVVVVEVRDDTLFVSRFDGGTERGHTEGNAN